MTGRLLVAVVAASLMVSACGGDDDSATTTSADSGDPTTTTGAQRQPTDGSSFFSIDEVLLGADGYVVLTNFTDVSVTLDGLHLCQGLDCFALPDEMVEAGGSAYIAVGVAPDVDAVVVPGASIGDLDPPDGELALYVDDPGDANLIVNYLEWGSTPHDRTADAIAKGLWREGSYAPSGDNAVRLYRNQDSGLWLWDAADS